MLQRHLRPTSAAALTNAWDPLALCEETWNETDWK